MKTDYVVLLDPRPRGRARERCVGFAPRQKVSGKMYIGGATSAASCKMIRRRFCACNIRRGKSRKPQACAMIMLGGFLCSLAPPWLISFPLCAQQNLVRSESIISAVERDSDAFATGGRLLAAPSLNFHCAQWSYRHHFKPHKNATQIAYIKRMFT